MRGGTKPWGRFAQSYIQSEYYSDMDMAVSGPLARSAGILTWPWTSSWDPLFINARRSRLSCPLREASRLKEFRVGLWIDERYSPRMGKSGIAFTTSSTDWLNRRSAQDRKTEHRFGRVRQTAGRSCHDGHDDGSYEPEETFDWAVSRRRALKDDDQSSQASWVRAVTAYHRDWNAIGRMRAIMRQKWDDYFQRFDVLLCPVARIAAHPHNHTELQVASSRATVRTRSIWTSSSLDFAQPDSRSPGHGGPHRLHACRFAGRHPDHRALS